MRRRKRLATIALAAVCALAGAAAGISQSAAANHPGTQRHAGNAPAGGAPPGMAGGPGGGRGGQSVHAVEEVLDKAGTAYISQTTDSGTITAVDSTAGTITLKEGTSTVTYATPTITIPSEATISLDGKTSSIGDLATGDRVTISSSSDGTNVFATDSSFHPSGGPGGMGGPPPSSSQSSNSSK